MRANEGRRLRELKDAKQAELDKGRRWCFLFTDLANPTSNRIYQAIGYRPVRDVRMFHFERP